MKDTLKLFTTKPFTDALTAFFEKLNIETKKLNEDPILASQLFTENLNDKAIQLIEEIYAINVDKDFLYQQENNLDNNINLLVFGISLKAKPSRTQLSEITRIANKRYKNTAINIVFKYENFISIANTERPKYKFKEGFRTGKVSLLKDIDCLKPHRGHLDILEKMTFTEQIASFEQVHQEWQKVFSISTLNKEFYKKLFDWYLNALNYAKFPQIRPESDKIPDDVHTSESLIRLLTRLLFAWFMKEKGLIPATLFDKKELNNVLKSLHDDDSNYYNAILQNLFFATLNKPIDERKALSKGWNPTEYADPLIYRYQELFANEENFLTHFQHIPFLNGGLFDCLDTKKTDKQQEIRLDGFSSKKEKQAFLPNFLFFGKQEVDLSTEYDDKKKNKQTVFGLIDILHQYKFTIEENTPIEEEIALDPELLGKVFENLLASYNPETKTTARKQTGSFYTPREIVDYMVDESLKAYLSTILNETTAIEENDNGFHKKLDDLLSYHNISNPFDKESTKKIIEAINHCKVLDPACGSGAYPMGVLQKMVHILQKLDPQNTLWLDKVIHSLPTAIQQKTKEKLKEEDLNYVRKLGIIQDCIYGIDIQPIATQITKLRFFISLLVDQKGNPTKENQGFEPLPNLDFKIVTANALINIPNDELTEFTQIHSKNALEEFDKKATEYFNAHTPKDKKQIKSEIITCINKIVETNKYATEAVINKIDKEKNSAKAKKLSDLNKRLETAQNRQALWQSYPNLFKHESVGFFETKYFFPSVKDGFDIVIGNPPYIQLQDNNGQLAKLYEKCTFSSFEKTGDIYALFYEKGIQLLKQNGTLNFITSNKWMRAGYGKSLRFLLANYNPLLLIDLGAGVFENATVDTNILLVQKTQNQEKTVACTLNKNSIENLPLFVQEHQLSLHFSPTDNSWIIANSIEQKIKEKIERIGKPLKEWDIQIYRGILTGYNDAFIIDGKKKDELIAQDPKSAEIIKPILRGRDIKRYQAEFADLWLINSHNGVRDKDYKGKDENKKWIVKPINVVKDYPAIYRHLQQYENQLIRRGDKGDHWTNLRNCAYIQEFEKEIICWKAVGRNLTFCLWGKDSFITAPASFISTDSKKLTMYLLSIFQSKYATHFILKNADSTGAGDVMLNIQSMEKLLIPNISPSAQLPFIKLVEKVLKGKEEGKDTSELEKQIDKLVYDLYELTDEEIAIVEGK